VGVYVIYLPKILDNIGYNTLGIGVVFAIVPLVRFIIPFLFLKHFKLSTKVFHLALILLVLNIPLLYITLENIYLFSLSILIYGAASSLILPYVDTYALQVLKKEVYGRARLYGSIGFIIVAIILAKYMSSNYAGINFMALSIIFCVFSAYLITKDSSFSKETQDNNKSNFLLTNRLPLWVSILLMQLSFGAFYSFFTIYEFERGVSYEEISYLWTFGVVCEIVLFYYQAKFLKLDLLFLIKLSILLTSFRWFLVYIYGDNLTIMYLSQSLHAFSFALYHTATLSYLAKIYHNKNLSSQFYHGIGFGLGGFLGSLLAGLFYGEYLFLFSAFIALMAYISLSYQKQLSS
jgi:PPP family 3-phenylpropionic acid transporter